MRKDAPKSRDESVSCDCRNTAARDERSEGNRRGEDRAEEDGSDLRKREKKVSSIWKARRIGTTHETDEENGVLGLSVLVDLSDPSATGENAVAGDGEDESGGGGNSEGGVLFVRASKSVPFERKGEEEDGSVR